MDGSSAVRHSTSTLWQTVIEGLRRFEGVAGAGQLAVSGPGSSASGGAVIGRIRWAPALEVLCWWAVCWGVWLTMQSSVTMQDAALGAAAGGFAALVAGFGRRAVAGRWRWQVPWWRWVGGALVAIPAETVRVLWRVYRHPRSTGYEEQLELPRDDRASVAQGRRAFASMALAVSPAAYVVDVEGEAGRAGGEDAGQQREDDADAGRSLRMHRLVPATPAGTGVDPTLQKGSAS